MNRRKLYEQQQSRSLSRSHLTRSRSCTRLWSGRRDRPRDDSRSQGWSKRRREQWRRSAEGFFTYPEVNFSKHKSHTRTSRSMPNFGIGHCFAEPADTKECSFTSFVDHHPYIYHKKYLRTLDNDAKETDSSDTDSSGRSLLCE